MSELYAIDKSTLEGIGNAIREKKGTTEPIPVTSLASEIESIESGGTPTSNTVGGNNYFSLVDMFYGAEDYTPSWGSQSLNGKLLIPDWKEFKDFTELRASQFDVSFYNNGNCVSSFTPSYGECYLIISGEQTVSPSFKEWFGGAWLAINESDIPGAGGGSTEAPKEYTLRSGIWTSKGSTEGNYINLPYPFYSVSADINGTVLDREFNRIVISGYGQGMDENNSLEGAPYPDIVFYNGDSHVWSQSGYGLDSSSFGFVINEDTPVTATFCLAFRGLFQ